MRTATGRRARRLVVLLALVGGMAVPGGAHAQSVYTGQLYTGTPVPNVQTGGPGVGGQVPGTGGFRAQGGADAGRVPPQSGRLALTGGDIAGLVAIGLGALGVGMVLTRGSRRPARR